MSVSCVNLLPIYLLNLSHAYVNICEYIYIYIELYRYVYTYMHACIRTYIYTYVVNLSLKIPGMPCPKHEPCSVVLSLPAVAKAPQPALLCLRKDRGKNGDARPGNMFQKAPCVFQQTRRV